MPSHSNRPPMRSPFDTQVHFLTELARAGVDALRRLSELNLQLARQLNDDALNATRALVSCSDPFHLALVAARAAEPAIGHWRSYQQQLGGVLSGAGLDLARGAAAPQRLLHPSAARAAGRADSRQAPHHPSE
ncbi:hypothetical protein F2P45_32825 [Massilia sp. CCM 8733]|uniref:Phasin domain-containing protein n=1 Tax=Massilia mucilaginosa TaxID=2609282 RepID=A0ABX0P3X6_9BURK|nr:phasin family protein [Massilia mucilaginosa]NHZ93748.1 hypothetical protein [Massilia mucilaginosa]